MQSRYSFHSAACRAHGQRWRHDFSRVPVARRQPLRQDLLLHELSTSTPQLQPSWIHSPELDPQQREQSLRIVRRKGRSPKLKICSTFLELVRQNSQRCETKSRCPRGRLTPVLPTALQATRRPRWRFLMRETTTTIPDNPRLVSVQRVPQ